MNNSWNLGTISGIKIRVHWTFLLLPLWIYFSSILAGAGTAAAATSLLFVLAIFGCVVLHEMGHALAARQFGIATRDITLLPIGGVAALERMPRNPLQELWVAVAGPLVNVVIASLIFIGLALTPLLSSGGVGTFIWQLGLANVALVVFNMIPAFPMDGGRVLRSVLAMFMNYASATNIAATVGQFVAVGFGLLGLFSGNLMLVFVAGFIFLAARAENNFVAASATSPYGAEPHSSPSRVPDNEGSGVAFLDDESVPASLSVSSVASWLASQRREYCAVVESGRVIGRISRMQLVEAIYQGLGRLPVGKLVTA